MKRSVIAMMIVRQFAFDVDYTGLPSDRDDEKLVINGRVYRDYDWTIVNGDEERGTIRVCVPKCTEI